MGRPSAQPDADARRRGDAVADGTSLLHARLVEELPDAVIGTDAEYRVTVWNPAAERLYGRSAAEAVGRHARELMTYAVDGARRELEAALDRHGWVRRELRVRRPPGDDLDVDVIVTTLRDEAGTVTGHLGIHRDVTERKRVETEHRRLSAIVQNSNDFIGMSDLEGRVLFVNDAGRRLVGLGSMEEARSKRVPEFFPPEDRQLIRDEHLPAVLAEGRRAWPLEFSHFDSGRRIPMWWDAFRVDDPQTGEPIAVATISRDLTEQQRAEAQLQAYRRRIDTIFARMTDAFLAVDRGLRLMYLNDRAAQLLGELLGTARGGDELLGRTIAETLPGVVGADLDRAMRRALSGRRTVTMEYLAVEHGQSFDIQIYPSDEGLGVYFRDVTVSRAAEAARQRQTRQAAAVAALGALASRGHDATDVIEEAVVAVACTLDVELVAISELRHGPEHLVVRAGAGWSSDAVGSVEDVLASRVPCACAVAGGGPLVVQDLEHDERCEPSELLRSHGVVSAAVVPIPGARTPFGALAVYARAARRFDDDAPSPTSSTPRSSVRAWSSAWRRPGTPSDGGSRGCCTTRRCRSSRSRSRARRAAPRALASTTPSSRPWRAPAGRSARPSTTCAWATTTSGRSRASWRSSSTSTARWPRSWRSSSRSRTSPASCPATTATRSCGSWARR
jgi:PAS domain S-box-containing protein